MSTTTKRPRRRRILLAALTFVLVAVLGVGGFYAWSVQQALSGMPREDLMPDDAPLTADPELDARPNLGTQVDSGAPAPVAVEEETTTSPIEGGVAEPGGSINPGRPGPGSARRAETVGRGHRHPAGRPCTDCPSTRIVCQSKLTPRTRGAGEPEAGNRPSP